MQGRTSHNGSKDLISNISDRNTLVKHDFDIYDIVFFFFFYIQSIWIFLANLLVIVSSCRYPHLQKPYGKELYDTYFNDLHKYNEKRQR